MKKKLLSLVLAGAMVASTSVSAFAATESTTTGETEISAGKDEQNVDVKVTGNILDNKGNAMPGTIKVTVPTATTFNVTKDGKLNSADMTIRNEGNEGIEVIVSGFEDASGTDKINIVKKDAFGASKENTERKNIWLRLTGGSKVVSFGSQNGGEVYEVNNGSDGTSKVSDTQIGQIASGRELTLRLEGAGGTQGANDATEPIQDDFKLVLKVKRVKVQ